MTVAVVRISPLALRAGPWDSPPGSFQVNGTRVDGAQVGWSDGAHRLVDIVLAGNPPTEYHTQSGQSYDLSGNTLTVTRTWSPPTLAAAKVILKNRLEADATQRWVTTRGANAPQIESSLSTGKSAIDAAANLVAALAAYNAVVWP